MIASRIRNSARAKNFSNKSFESESEDEVLINTIDESSSISNFGRSTMFFNQRQAIRTSLKNFFMNPFDKFQERGRKPWKLFFHLLKLILITAMLIVFGQDKFQLRNVLNAYQFNLGNLLIENYQEDPDYGTVNPIIHRQHEIADSVAFSIVNYYNLTSNAVGIYGYKWNKTENTICLPRLCVSTFEKADIDISEWRYNFNEKIITTCFEIDCQKSTIPHCAAKAREVLPTKYDNFVSLNITFELRSIFLSLKTSPKCVNLFATSTLSNTDISGGIISLFKLNFEEIACNSSSSYKPNSKLISLREQIGQIVLDILVIMLTFITMGLVIKRIWVSWKLYRMTQAFYEFHYTRNLTFSEVCCFINGWDLFNIIADVLTLIGIAFKIFLDTGLAGSHIDWTAVLIGTSVGLHWILSLRFLSFNKGCYILVLTLSVAFPNICRFIICGIAIYMGYVFCGWLVFGPYVQKFNSISQTTESLFALINGDEILDTFMLIKGDNKVLWVFSKFYFYTFIMLFTYVVLSVMISLISDAMVVAQSRAGSSSSGPWMVGKDVFPELQLGWDHNNEEGGEEEAGNPIPADNLNSTNHRM